jgi:hypothetical protein
MVGTQFDFFNDFWIFGAQMIFGSIETFIFEFKLKCGRHRPLALVMVVNNRIIFLISL